MDWLRSIPAFPDVSTVVVVDGGGTGSRAAVATGDGAPPAIDGGPVTDGGAASDGAVSDGGGVTPVDAGPPVPGDPGPPPSAPGSCNAVKVTNPSYLGHLSNVQIPGGINYTIYIPAGYKNDKPLATVVGVAHVTLVRFVRPLARSPSKRSRKEIASRK